MKLKRWISASLACIMSMAWVLVSSPIQAQESDEVYDEDEVIETIVVTGSRIRRDSFSSPSPIQVLDVESGRGPAAQFDGERDLHPEGDPDCR